MRGPRFRPLGAPLRVSVDSCAFPILIAIGVFGQVHHTTFVPELDAPDPRDLEASARWLGQHPDPFSLMGEVSTGWSIAAAVVTVVLLLLSILAHEIGHAVAARLAGLRVDAIDLGFTGGWVTLHDSDALTAGKLAAIAAAGPAVTALLAAVLSAVLAALGWGPLGTDTDLPTSAFMATAQAVFPTILYFNLFCLVLNLLPIRPLDGHKLVLAGRLWRTRHGH